MNILNAAEGAAELIVFFIVLILALLGINTYRHIRNGVWKGFLKAADIVIMLLFAALAVAFLMLLHHK